MGVAALGLALPAACADSDTVNFGQLTDTQGTGAAGGACDGCGGSSEACGDGACIEPETCIDCPEDCGGCPSCGDEVCGADEDCSTCPADCGDCAKCGDGTCDPAEGCADCPADCGDCPASCGDGTCDADESCTNCPADCGACPPSCGNGTCDANETCSNCIDDCGACPPSCPDGTCDPNESCSSCAADCGACPPMCGNGACDGNETCASCVDDCGMCPCVADAFEPNNGSATATPVSKGVDHCNLSICAGDVDWLEFSVTSSLTATITFVHAQGDLELEIYSAQTLNYVDGSYGNGNSETVTLSGLSAGTYWARVYGAGGNENPDYCFHVDAP